ncbi:MAG: hypothetical protein K8S55_15575 [Phycisphaerae bacterium]|nr:hypothetical protein [Phycisphaerae bacterium]
MDHANNTKQQKKKNLIFILVVVLLTIIAIATIYMGLERGKAKVRVRHRLEAERASSKVLSSPVKGDTGQALQLPRVDAVRTTSGLDLSLYNDSKRPIRFDLARDGVIVFGPLGEKRIHIKEFLESGQCELLPSCRSRVVAVKNAMICQDKVTVRFEHRDQWGTYGTGKTLTAPVAENSPGTGQSGNSD